MGERLVKWLEEAQDLSDEEFLARHPDPCFLASPYRRSEDLVNLGAYSAGSNPKLDRALQARDDVEAFLKQDLSRSAPIESTIDQLRALAEKV